MPQSALALQPWMCRLQPRIPVTTASAASADVRSRALAELGEGPVAWAVQAGAVLLAEMQRSAAEFGGGLATSRGIETHLLSLLLQVKDDRLAGGPEVPEASLEDARALARSGVPAVVLTEAVWRLHAQVQEAMLSAVLELGQTRTDEAFGDRMRNDILRLTRYSQFAATVLLAAYEEEHEASWEGRTVRRREAISRLVHGEPVTARDEDLIGVRLNGFHLLATVTGAESRPSDGDARLVQFAWAVTGRLPGCSLITTSLDSEKLLWWSRAQPIDDADLDRVRRITVPEGMTVAFGDPHAGPDGVAQGYAEATRAATVAHAAGDTQQSWVHGDVLLASALLADPTTTRDLVARELAGVLGRDGRSAELRRTVLQFLRSGGSRQAVAKELDVAPTTVAYRVERFEQLRGRPLQASRLETWVALEIVDLAPSMLSGSGG